MAHEEAGDAVRRRRTEHGLRTRLDQAIPALQTRAPRAAAFAVLLRDVERDQAMLWGPRARAVDVQAGVLATALAPDDVRALATALCPRIADDVVAACATIAHRPYLAGSLRRPFRCPESREGLGHVRGRWLLRTALCLGDYDVDIGWIAAHAAHLDGWWEESAIGWLLAGAIDRGGRDAEEVQAILEASAAGEHATGQMSRLVIHALLSCARPAAWDFVVRLLLAAQRQEGLRQAILESVDEAHPAAFKRMLQVIRAENLVRFSATVRAFDVWCGFLWDGASAFTVNDAIDRIGRLLDDPAARTAALDERDGETVYLALWSTAFEDVDVAIPLAIPLLEASEPERRFAAAHFLVQSAWSTATPALVRALDDPDLRIVARALDAFAVDQSSFVDGADLFARLEAVLARVPRRAQVLPAIVWPWTSRRLEREQVGAAMFAHAEAVPLERFRPYVGELSALHRGLFLRQRTGVPSRWDVTPVTSARPPLTPALRDLVIDALGDASPDVREVAFEALGGSPVEPDEATRLVALLGRTAGDLRRRALDRLRTLDAPTRLSTAEALLDDARIERRVAGLELLRDSVERSAEADAARQRIRAYVEGRVLTEAERAHVDAVFSGGEVATLDDALGLVQPGARRPWPAPAAKPLALRMQAATACVESLAALVLEHQHSDVVGPTGERALLVDAGRHFGVAVRSLPAYAKDAGFPLETIWKAWAATRGASLRDADGLELVRALLAPREGPVWNGERARQLIGESSGFSPGLQFLETLLEWCVYWAPPEGAPTFLLDGLETSLAGLTTEDLDVLHEQFAGRRFRLADVGLLHRPWADAPVTPSVGDVEPPVWYERALWHREHCPGQWHGEHATRLYALLRWFQIASAGAGALTLTLPLVLDAVREGAVDHLEFIDLLVGPWSRQPGLSLLRDVSRRKPPPELVTHHTLLDALTSCRRRIVEVECRRGDRRTAATPAALDLQWTGGLETVGQALSALGRSKFARTASWRADGSRTEVLSHLILRSTPLPTDTHETFAERVRRMAIPEAQLIELALYAPQWAGHVQHLLGWDGFEDGVWWLQAHTKDDRAWSLGDLKELWAADISERTPLTAGELMEGAVDVGWFHRVFAQLGGERWSALEAAAKYGTSGPGHTRAQLFARALAGSISRDALMARIDEVRHQDSVRALGLVPLSAALDGQGDVLARYRRLQAFRAEARAYGAQRQQSERRAVDIGMANLARTAAYRDPQRLQWAMEREALGDLLRGPVVVSRGDVALALSIDADGTPALSVTRAGRSLKDMPSALRRDPDIVALKERLQELRQQRRRVSGALEDAMCRGDAFDAPELIQLMEHPMLAPALSRLVLIAQDGVAGYPIDDGRLLVAPDGTRHPMAAVASLRIAHPHDLFAMGTWSQWQRDCLEAERVQPFKQVFRELYPITDGERDGTISRRYAGHQVQVRQGITLLGGRGWVAHPEEGVRRTFHAEGLTARVGFQEASCTPADVEGLTLEAVVFTKKGSGEPLPLADVPPRVFSETMRDIDLMVSVAHRGGVDPEATASTVEMRAALVRDVCAVLRLDMVRVTGHHAIVHGARATYAVHLGSANAVVLPATALHIVAVHAQHRGRLFLPFADDDPRTAEVLSKVLLLARDREIKDPSILAQIRSAVSVPPAS